jgi:hypothetical protein
VMLSMSYLPTSGKVHMGIIKCRDLNLREDPGRSFDQISHLPTLIGFRPLSPCQNTTKAEATGIRKPWKLFWWNYYICLFCVAFHQLELIFRWGLRLKKKEITKTVQGHEVAKGLIGSLLDVQ